MAEVPLRPYTDLKYKVVSKVYDNHMQRNICIQTIPKGTLLYHYYNTTGYLREDNSTKNNAYNEEVYYKEKLIHYFSRFAFQKIQYNKENDTVEFELSSALVNPKYYYGVPYAAYGVQINVQSPTYAYYDTMFPVVVKEDMHIAYLNSGSEIPDETTLHRGYPDPDNFNFHRAAGCSAIGKSGSKQYNGKYAGWPSSTDECLRRQFAAEESLDGITAIAENDSMMIYNRKTGKYTHHTLLYHRFEMYMETLIQDKATDYQKSIYATITLGLNQDTRGDKDIIGFKEYALHPFGKKGYTGKHFLPKPEDGSYTIDESVEGEYQKIRVPFANFQAVYTKYIEPNLIVKPLRIFNSMMFDKDESVDPDSIFLPETRNFVLDETIVEKAGRIQPPVPIRGQVAHSLFFDWLLDSKYTLLFNPLVNLFGIYQEGYPYSYEKTTRYENGFEVNTALDDIVSIRQQFTNVSLDSFVHDLTQITTHANGTQSYTLDSAAINSALECTLVKAVLADESRRMNVYSYLPIWDALNPVSTGPSKSVLIGPFFELQNTHIMKICDTLYNGIPFQGLIRFPLGMFVDNNLIESIVKRFAEQNGVDYMGKIVPPPSPLANINTTLFQGGRRTRRRRIHKRTQKRRPLGRIGRSRRRHNRKTLKTK